MLTASVLDDSSDHHTFMTGFEASLNQLLYILQICF